MKHVLLVFLAFFAIHSVTAQTPCSNKGFTATMSPISGQPLRVAVATTNAIPLPTHSWGYIMYSWGDNSALSFDNLPAASGSTVYHNYTSTGSYNIRQRVYAYDSSFNATICVDSIDQLFTVGAQPCATSVTSTQSANTVTLTANNLASTPGMTYSWSFGDGNTATGSPVTHTYAAVGNYTVTLVATAPAPAGCAYTSTLNVWVTSIAQPPLNCNALTANFTTTTTNKTVAFFNTSTTIASPGTRSFQWSFGDGASSTLQSPTHPYAFAATYTVRLVTTWNNGSSQCKDTVIKTVTTTNPPPPPTFNRISGGVIVDTADLDSAMSFMVWLIQYDSVTNMLTAVDSTLAVYTGTTSYYYEFNNKAAGTYLAKAHLLNGPTAGLGYIPTYYISYLYWAQANNIIHTGGNSGYNYIFMQKGTVTTGPGFVGGNVSQGANKGTSGGLGNMLIIIRDANTTAVRSTFTDGNGNYSVGNLPVGTYTVYPEDLGYSTTPAPITITANKPSVTNIDFERSHSTMSIQPKATGIDGINAANLFAVYPNPANGIVYIRSAQNLADAKVNVTDVTGRTIQSVILGNHTENKLDISTLQNGLYYITIQANEITHTEKVMILH